MQGFIHLVVIVSLLSSNRNQFLMGSIYFLSIVLIIQHVILALWGALLTCKPLYNVHWIFLLQCPPCNGFNEELKKIYRKLKSEQKNFEIVYVSSDRTEEYFLEYYADMEMPWLALPFGDSRIAQITRYFDVEGLHSLFLSILASRMLLVLHSLPNFFLFWCQGLDAPMDANLEFILSLEKVFHMY